MNERRTKSTGSIRTTLDELMEKFEALSPEERRADIEWTNRYLASEKGQKEFAEFLKPGNSGSGLNNG